MRTRLLARLGGTLGLAAALMCGLPATAHASTWAVPTGAVPAVTLADIGQLSSAELEDALMVRINAARASHGLQRIWSFDACTDRLAEKWGSRIARTGVLEHRDQHKVVRRCHVSWAGEALVRGEALTPDVMVDLWLASPSHREILLSPRARRAGVAIAQDAEGRTVGVVNLVRHR